jgi:hypothetical protein
MVVTAFFVTFLIMPDEVSFSTFFLLLVLVVLLIVLIVLNMVDGFRKTSSVAITALKV